jgi:hypothetical protein
MVMDGRGRVESHSRRTSIKRPWDEDLEPPETVVPGVWHGGRLFLPPIDAVPYRRHSVSAATEVEGNSHIRYGLDMRESRGASKRPRYEEHDYNSMRGNSDLVGKTLQTQSSVRKCRGSTPNPVSNSLVNIQIRYIMHLEVVKKCAASGLLKVSRGGESRMTAQGTLLASERLLIYANDAGGLPHSIKTQTSLSLVRSVTEIPSSFWSLGHAILS